MVATNRLEQKRLQTHQQLLETAAQVFSQKGYEDTSILDITEAANVSKRTFYLHFTDKDALLMELAYQSFEKVRQRIVEAEEQTRDILSPAESFETSLRTIFEFAGQHPEIMEIAVKRDGSPKLNAMMREYLARSMEDHINDENCPHFLNNPGIPPIIIANVKAGVVFQMLCWWVQNPGRYSPDEMAAVITKIIYDGVGELYKLKESAEE